MARGIPRLLFLMADEHPVRPKDVETGPGAEKLAALKAELERERAVAFFDSPADRRAEVVQALYELRPPGRDTIHHVAGISRPP